ncbi:MAG: hypothetical protein EKK62_09590 [Acidimicrobiia bacterium]|nr:MAG: hypothetical protein EKK62_09590 [Acidimicrobiia bacterium]
MTPVAQDVTTTIDGVNVRARAYRTGELCGARRRGMSKLAPARVSHNPVVDGVTLIYDPRSTNVTLNDPPVELDPVTLTGSATIVDLRVADSGDRVVLDSEGLVHVVNRSGVVVNTIAPPYGSQDQRGMAVAIDGIGRVFVATGTGSVTDQSNAAIWLFELDDETEGYELVTTLVTGQYVSDLAWSGNFLYALQRDEAAGRSSVVRYIGFDAGNPTISGAGFVPHPAYRMAIGPNEQVAVSSPATSTTRGIDPRQPDAGPVLEDDLASWFLADITDWETTRYAEFDPADLDIDDGEDVTEWLARDGLARRLECPYGTVSLHGLGLPLYNGATVNDGDYLELYLPDRSIVETYTFRTTPNDANPGEVVIAGQPLDNLKKSINSGDTGAATAWCSAATQPSVLVSAVGVGSGTGGKIDLVCNPQHEVVLAKYVAAGGSTVQMGWFKYATAGTTTYSQTESVKTVTVEAPKLVKSGIAGRPCVRFNGAAKLVTKKNTSKRPTEVNQQPSIFPGGGTNFSTSGSSRFAAFFLIRPDEMYTAACVWGQSIQRSGGNWDRVLATSTGVDGIHKIKHNYMAVQERHDNGGSGTNYLFETQVATDPASDEPPTVRDWRLMCVISDPQSGGGKTSVWCNGLPVPRVTSAAFPANGVSWHETQRRFWGVGIKDAMVAGQDNYVVVEGGTGVLPGAYKVASWGSSSYDPNLDYLELDPSAPSPTNGGTGNLVRISAIDDFGDIFDAISEEFANGDYVRFEVDGGCGVVDDPDVADYKAISVVGATFQVEDTITPATVNLVSPSQDPYAIICDVQGYTCCNSVTSVANDSLSETHIGQYPLRQNGSGSSVSGDVSTALPTRSLDRFWVGDIYRIAVLHSLTATAISTSDREKVEGKLAWEFGAQNLLPQNHPYRAVPPPPDGSTTDDLYKARAALSSGGIVTRLSGSDLGATWCVARVDGNTSYDGGGMGSGVVWSPDGDIVISCGFGHVFSGHSYCVVGLDDDADGATLWGHEAGPLLADSITGTALRLSLDSFGNVLIPFSSSTWSTGDKPLALALDPADGTLVWQFDGSDDPTCIAADKTLELEGTIATSDDRAVVGASVIRTLEVYSHATTASLRARATLVVCNGHIAKIDPDLGTATIATGGNAALSSTARYVQSATLFGKVFWTDGVGPYRVYNPRTDEVSEFRTTSRGALEPNCVLMETYRGALLLARPPSNPHNWFLTKRSDPFNMDLNPLVPSSVQAVAGNNSLAGLVDDLVNGFAAWNDDLGVFFGDHSIWRLTGDPAANGQLDLMTRSVGGAFGRAYCFGPGGELYFWASEGGLWVMSPGGLPQPITTRIHDKVRDFDLSTYYVRMAWDNDQDALLIFFCPYGGTAASIRSLVWERVTNSMWEDERSNLDHQVSSVFILDGDSPADRHVQLGCRDGYVRQIDRSDDDDGSPIVSSVTIGPISSRDSRYQTKLSRLQVLLDHAGGAAYIGVYTSDTPTSTGERRHLLTLLPGLSPTFSARAVGGYIWLKLHGSQPWSWQAATAIVQPGPHRRIRYQ